MADKKEKAGAEQELYTNLLTSELPPEGYVCLDGSPPLDVMTFESLLTQSRVVFDPKKVTKFGKA